MLERFLLLWLCLLSLVAFFWPELNGPLGQTWQVPDPFEATQGSLNYLFAVTMFAIGWMLPRDEVREVLRRWPTVLAGTALQYTSMPLLAFVLGRMFQLGDTAMIGMIMVGCVPGAMASNVLTLLARGNVSYSLSLTTTATVLSPVFVPLALWLTLGQRVSFPTASVSWKLCWMVVAPVLVGHALGRSLSGWKAFARRFGSAVANGTILWIIAVVVAVNRDEIGQTDLKLVLALLSLNLLGYGAGFAGAALLRLPVDMRRALTLEIGTQNAGLGTVLTLALFADRPSAAIPPALYTFGCMATGTMLARWWAIRSQRGEPLPVPDAQ